MTDKNSKNDKIETNDEHNGYLFSIDVLVKGRTNGHALEVLTHLLNEDQVTDYRIIKGINLGQIISANLDKPKEKITQPKSGAITDTKSQITTVKKDKEGKVESKVVGKIDNKTEIKTVEAKSSKHNQTMITTDQIEKYKENKSLVRITINKGKGVKLSIPCRILNFDWASGNITAYHVDEKKVYSIDLSEIDDLTSG